MRPTTNKRLFDLSYRLGGRFWESFPIDSTLAAIATERNSGGADRRRALDIGCGTGRYCRFLAANGWEVTGVDVAHRAITRAEEQLHGLDLDVQLLCGDVTKPVAIGLRGPFELFVDVGCYHGLSPQTRRDYAKALSDLSDVGSTLWIWGLGARRFGIGFSAEELQAVLIGWSLEAVDPLSEDEVRHLAHALPRRYAFWKVALLTSLFQPLTRFRFRRTAIPST